VSIRFRRFSIDPVSKREPTVRGLVLNRLLKGKTAAAIFQQAKNLRIKSRADGIWRQQRRHLDRAGLLLNIHAGVTDIYQGREWLDPEGREGVGREIYHKGLSLAFAAF
jgi:hypothetical protein